MHDRRCFPVKTNKNIKKNSLALRKILWKCFGTQCVNVQLFQMYELFCRSLNSLSFCVNFFELISCVVMIYTCGVPGCTTGYESNKSDKILLYLDFPLMKILKEMSCSYT